MSVEPSVEPSVAPRGTGVAQRPSGRPARSRSARLVSDAALVLMAAVYALPVVYALLGSLRPDDRVLDGWRGLLPVGLTTRNYVDLVTRTMNSEATGYLWRFFLVSFVVTGTVVVGGLVVNSMAAFAFARLEWRGRDTVMLGVVALVVIPFEAIAVPLYWMLNDHGHKVLVQILPFVANAFSIYLFYSFFIGIPRQLDEAARIDGAGPWRVFWYVVVPISRPVFATVAVLTFLTTWGQYLWPLLVVSPADSAAKPLPSALGFFAGLRPRDLLGQQLAFGMLMVAPVVVAYLVFQRWFIAGVASSGLKG